MCRDAGRLGEYPGVWVDADGPERPRKIAAIGVRLARGRTMHGFALNVTTDMTYMREHIVACGIADRPVTSLAEEGIDVSMREVVDVVARLARAAVGERRLGAPGRRVAGTATTTSPRSRAARGPASRSRSGRPGPHARLEQAGVTDGLSIETRKPDWLRPKVRPRARR